MHDPIRLVNLLLKNGDQVSVLNRGNGKATFDGEVTPLIADRSDEFAMRKVIHAGDEWDVIYDQCCQSPSEAKLACEIFEGKTGRYVIPFEL